jgi:hypothetical protein
LFVEAIALLSLGCSGAALSALFVRCDVFRERNECASPALGWEGHLYDVLLAADKVTRVGTIPEGRLAVFML